MSTTIDKVKGFEYPESDLSSKIVKYKGRTDFMNYINVEDAKEFIKRVKRDVIKLIDEMDYPQIAVERIINKHAGEELIN